MHLSVVHPLHLFNTCFSVTDGNRLWDSHSDYGANENGMESGKSGRIMGTRTTVAQFETFIALPEHANRRFELIHGVISEKTPTQPRSYILQMLSGFLFVFLRQNPLG